MRTLVNIGMIGRRADREVKRSVGSFVYTGLKWYKICKNKLNPRSFQKHEGFLFSLPRSSIGLEYLAFNQGVLGSRPSGGTKYSLVAQLAE